jgi:hypothetical protein
LTGANRGRFGVSRKLAVVCILSQESANADARTTVLTTFSLPTVHFSFYTAELNAKGRMLKAHFYPVLPSAFNDL